ncbi:MAG: tetratricopeptide repeat protein, partial [Pseudolabrys sp.]
MTALPFRLQRIFARRPARLRLASAWRTLTFIVVLLQTLALLALAPLSAARADEPIKGEVKAVNDGGFLRLMFQFDEAVEATTRVSGAIVNISFNKPVALAVERLNVNAPDYISAARRDPDGSAIRLALLRKVKVNTIAAAERLYVDLLPEAWKGPMPGLPQEVIDELVRRARTAESQLHQQRAADKQKKPPVVRVKVATQPTFVRYVFTMPGTVNVIPERADGRLTLNFDQQVAWDLADAKASLPPTLKSIESEVDFDSVAVVFTLSGTPEVRAFREERSIVVDIGLEGAKPKQSEEVGPAKPVVASGGAPAISAPNSRSPKTSAAEILPPKTSAPPPAPVAAAAASQEAGPAKPVPEAVPPKQAEQSQPAPSIAQPAMAVPAPQVLAASEP